MGSVALLLRAADASKKPISLWHQRLAHLGLDSIRKLQELAIGIEFDNPAERHKNLVERPKNQPVQRPKICPAYVRDKQQKRPLNIRRRDPYRHSKKPFDLVHSDVCEMPEEGYDGSRYFITFTDDYTRITFVKRLRIKDEAFQAFKDFCAFIKTQFGVTVRRIRSDNGDEYADSRFQKKMTDKGIKWEPTVAYNPHENGVAEHLNQILLNKMICMLADSDLPRSLWPELIDTAAYLWNQSPTKHLDKTPHEALHDVKPNLSHFKIIGCPCWAQIPSEKRDKLDFKSKECRLLGYEASTQFILWDVEDQRVIFSRNVQFDELVQDLCDIEAVQLFRNKINEMHQIGEEQNNEKSGDEYSNQSSSLSPSPSHSGSRSRSQSPFPSPFKLPEPEEEPDELLDFFRANIPNQITFSSFGRRL